jgi:hypothetical protein
MKLTLHVAKGFSATTESGEVVESGKAYEMTPRIDEYVRMGILTPEPDESEEDEGERSLEDWTAHFGAMKVAELRDLANEAGLDVPGNSKKDVLAAALAQHAFGFSEEDVSEEEIKRSEWIELLQEESVEQLLERAEELEIEVPGAATKEDIIELLVDAELEGDQ